MFIFQSKIFIEQDRVIRPRVENFIHCLLTHSFSVPDIEALLAGIGFCGDSILRSNHLEGVPALLFSLQQCGDLIQFFIACVQVDSSINNLLNPTLLWPKSESF